MSHCTTARIATITRALSVMASFFTLRAAAQPVQFIPLGMPPNATESRASAISADGAVVAGQYSIPGAGHAFRWTAGGGLQSLGHLPGIPTAFAAGISADGLTIVGAAGPALRPAFRWTAATGILALPVPPDSAGSLAYAASGDGSVIVGEEYPPAGSLQAVRWVSGTIMDLSDLPGGERDCAARDITPDGSVIVGDASSASGRQACRWTAAGDAQGIGDVAGGQFDSIAFCVNADGSVIGGTGVSLATGVEAFRWTAVGGMQGLGRLAGTESSDCADVSADGAIMVGNCIGGGVRRAFLWSQPTGMLDLREHLLALGATGLNGWQLNDASAISADGRTVCGWGRNPVGRVEGWIAVVPLLTGCPGARGDANCDGAINLFDIDPFVTALLDISAYATAFCDGALCAVDVDCNGAVNFFDIDPMLNCLFTSCPGCP